MSLGLGPARAEPKEPGDWQYYLTDVRQYREEVESKLKRALGPWLRDLTKSAEQKAHAAIISVSNDCQNVRRWDVGFHTSGLAYVCSDHAGLRVLRAGSSRTAQAYVADLRWIGDTATLSSLVVKWAPQPVPGPPRPREWKDRGGRHPALGFLELPTYIYSDRVESVLPETVEFRRRGDGLGVSWAEAIVLARYEALAALGTEERPLPKFILLQTSIPFFKIPDEPPQPPADR